MHETIIITTKNNFKEHQKNIFKYIFEENYYSLVSYIHINQINYLNIVT